MTESGWPLGLKRSVILGHLLYLFSITDLPMLAKPIFVIIVDDENVYTLEMHTLQQHWGYILLISTKLHG
jgi:hypothetical protein